jgi:hypothetical protein
MSFLDDMANAETWGSGNYFKAGKGRVIVKDVKLFKGEGDPRTYVVEFIVKSSEPIFKDEEPNAPGTSVSYIQKLTRAAYPKQSNSNAKSANLAILGPDAEVLSPADLKKEFEELMRLDAEGYTKPGTVCPARGIELAYETLRKTTRKGEEMDFPKFTHIPPTKESVAENLALLGAAEKAESEAA